QGAANAGGGGLAMHMLSSHNSSMDFCTISGNVASVGGGIATDWIGTPKTADLALKNSIVAANTATTAPDISGAITTEGYNLVQRFSDALINDPTKKHQTDLSGETLAHLGIDTHLSNNGGPTPTLALQADSPALNVIPATACDVPTDQRGVKRPQHTACDIGAYEYS
ncbi:MAG TPA: choice-of-anchor Q domain-containing protein, partial [Ktedonobacteraceae bacterium]|nr:choice-of-anchor Q domain-containing protein [Ktedonobacteraceae bacterium]